MLRIFSDLHYGDPASALTSLSSLTPLFDGADEIVLNGDTLDTRPSLHPEHTAALIAEIRQTFSGLGRPVTFLTGNHDPDITTLHARHFPEYQLFATHGDAFFDDLVPWSRDALLARKLVADELAALPASERSQLSAQLTAIRRAAFRIPRRHQSYPRGLRYLIESLQETVWPPSRGFRILRAWRETPARADAFIAQHSIAARFLAMGHTHRFGAFRTPSGLMVLNTGAFCPPCQTGVIDLGSERICLRLVERRGREYRLGRTIAEFALARR